MDDTELIDRIYEAGVVPELWPDVLHHIGELAGGSGALLLAPSAGQLRWSASPGIVDMLTGYLEREYLRHDDRTARLLASGHTGFLTDLDVFTLEEWEADPIRQDYLEPNGYGWGIATAVRLPGDELYIFHSERQLSKGPFGPEDVERLDPLRPHLARAALMSSKLAFERSQGALAGMDIMGVPAGVLDDQGRLLAANAFLEKLIPAVVRAGRQRISLVQSHADHLLALAIEALAASRHGATTQSIPLRQQSEHGPMVVHLHPARRTGRDVFGRAATFLIVTPLGSRNPPAVPIIQALLDLTVAEARVAHSIAAGQSIGEISSATGVGVGTVRGQAKSVLRKTGLHRQSDLVGLLTSMPSIGGSNRK